MYVDRCEYTTKYGVIHVRYLLRESFRENGKVMHRTILNLTPYGEETALAIQLALTHRREFTQLARQIPGATVGQGRSIGAVWVLFQLAEELGLVEALGSTRQGKLALWQVFARAIDQGSRLSAVRLAAEHAACDILDLDAFDEDDLYENLDWLTENQPRIEQRLFRTSASRRKSALAKQDRLAEQEGGGKRASFESDSSKAIFLYDVTSSDFEGKHNDLAAFGYNRDGKRGKLQVVAGLLCNGEGVPLSIELFRGNTQDPQTMGPQIRKAAVRFDAEHVVFVGDRGMIKGPQMQKLDAVGFHYITAITKPQIESLLRQGVIQMELFDEELTEVIQHDDGDGDGGKDRESQASLPLTSQSAACRGDGVLAQRQAGERRQASLPQGNVISGRPFLRECGNGGYRKVAAKIAQLKLGGWLNVSSDGRRLVSQEDAGALAEASKLDGCYCLTTDLKCEQASKDTVHDRYKDLVQVEWAFRTGKTAHLELRPIHVRKENRTRGHALVVMLAYRLIQELARRWAALDVKVEEGLKSLATLCARKCN